VDSVRNYAAALRGGGPVRPRGPEAKARTPDYFSMGDVYVHVHEHVTGDGEAPHYHDWSSSFSASFTPRHLYQNRNLFQGVSII